MDNDAECTIVRSLIKNLNKPPSGFDGGLF